MFVEIAFGQLGGLHMKGLRIVVGSISGALLTTLCFTSLFLIMAFSGSHWHLVPIKYLVVWCVLWSAIYIFMGLPIGVLVLNRSLLVGILVGGAILLIVGG